MSPERTARELLPDAVSRVLEEFERSLSTELRLWAPRAGGGYARLYPEDGHDESTGPLSDSLLLQIPTRHRDDLVLEVAGECPDAVRGAAGGLRTALEGLYEYADEVRFFTHEVAERYEEINLLYSISETLGSLLRLDDAARFILQEVCEVLAARRASLWVYDPQRGDLEIVASVGEEGLEGPLSPEDASAVTSRVFREGRAVILPGGGPPEGAVEGSSETEAVRGFRGTPAPARGEPVLSVPIRYTPPDGEPRTVGVMNLIGHRRGGHFTASDRKLLAAIASQVGAALENHRLVRESLEQERVGREMELAHDLQMKLLPGAGGVGPELAAARVEPAESVGGDFYHFLRLAGGRYGVMIGDVSGHGFPAALIMALTMSAATIYATELRAPARVLTEMSQALLEELEGTEMYLTFFYAVVDPGAGELVYANAGHPHAFVIRGGGEAERLAPEDVPMGVAGPDEYHQRTVPWEAGADLLLLFTDGLSDDLVPDSRMEGEERVVAEAVRLREAPPGEIVEALFRLTPPGGPPEDPNGDDRTAVVFRA